MSGSWLDIRVKRDIYKERRLRVVWDEDGQSVEQVYLYSTEAPGLWTADQLPPLEREMMARGIGKQLFIDNVKIYNSIRERKKFCNHFLRARILKLIFQENKVIFVLRHNQSRIRKLIITQTADLKSISGRIS